MNYDFSKEEPDILAFWKGHQIFQFNPNSTKPIFSIDTPPPTMSGRMHIGHAASYTQQDIIARYKRMKGFELFFPFGTDDNGLPTEKLVQKERNVNLRKMSRDQAIRICQEFLKQERPTFIQDWINVGMSCDFDICYSTIDDHSRKIAQQTFLELVKQKRAYRKEAPVIWDTKFQTAIAQAELEDMQRTSLFNDIVFKTQTGEDLLIATTRPELLGACVAVFAHPSDTRYQNLFGTFAYSPLYNAKVPILADERADPEKGTGIVMCCTFGDQTDIEWYKIHNLPLKMIITKDGKMNDASGKYVGMSIEDARKEIILDLQSAGLLKKQTQIMQTVNVGERSGVPVEIINTKQWYIQYLDEKENFLQGSEQLHWTPYFMKHRLDNWINNLGWDWAISRQRHFGIPIPVWYDEQGNEYYADETQLPVDPLKDRPLSAPHNVTLIAETDVFDTWFTSASSPFLAIDYFKENPVYKKLFPMSLRPQAHDIISFWLFYTMAKTRLLHSVNPWNNIIISGWILDPKGQKMSKSKGNTIDPREMMKKHSADAMRWWAGSVKLGEDTPFKEQELLLGKKLVTKLWNATRFATLNLENYAGQKPQELQPFDAWMLLRTSDIIDQVSKDFENYDYAGARYKLDQFFWSVCDNYLEIVKDRLYKPEIYGEDAKISGQYTLNLILRDMLKMFAPFVPFVTEKLYQEYFKEKESIHIDTWPTGNYGELSADMKLGQQAVELIATIRRAKAEAKISLGAPIEMITIPETLRPFATDIKGTVKAQAVEFGEFSVKL